MRRFIPFLALALMPSAAVLAQNARFEQGQEALAQGYETLASADLDEAIRLAPADACAYGMRGTAHGALGNHDQAMRDFAEAIRLDPQDGYAYRQRGVLAALKEEYDQAIVDLSEALRRRPTDAYAFNMRGVAHSKRGAHRLAIDDLTESIRLDAKSSTAFSNRGAAYLELWECEKVIADCTEAIRLDPGNSRAYFNRGLANARNGEHRQAIPDFSESIRLNPRDPSGPYQRGSARERHRTRRGRRPELATKESRANASTHRPWWPARRLSCRRADAHWGTSPAPTPDGRGRAILRGPCVLLRTGPGWPPRTVPASSREAVRWQEKALEIGTCHNGHLDLARQRLRLYQEGRPCRGIRGFFWLTGNELP